MSEEKNEIILIENLTGNSLVNVTEFKKKIQDVKKANPIIEITDNASYEVAKKSRTAVKSVRVEIDNQDKAIGSAFAKVRKETIKINESLVEEIKPFELEHEANVKAWEDRKEKERQEKERIDNERIEKIKTKVSEIETGCYELIQKMQFSDVSDTHKKVCEILNQEFDYEEYDILHSQTQNRVLAAFDDKQADLKQKEAQRAENERLERQNKRLEALYPVMAFTQGVEIMNLHALEENDFKIILQNASFAKEEAERKAEEAREKEKESVFEMRKDRLAQLGFSFYPTTELFCHPSHPEFKKETIYDLPAVEFETFAQDVFENIKAYDEEQRRGRIMEEKEEVFEIRKTRLEKIGMSFNDYRFTHPDIFNILDKKTIFECAITEFENIVDSIEKAIETAKEEKVLKERFAERANQLELKGFTLGINEMHLKGELPTSINNIKTMPDDEWEAWLNCIDGAIAENIKEEEEKRKASDARQKALRADKGRVIAYVASLEFRDAVPNFKNAESEQMLKEVEQRFSEFKEYIVEYVNKF